MTVSIIFKLDLVQRLKIPWFSLCSIEVEKQASVFEVIFEI